MRLMLWFWAFTQLPLPAQSGADIDKNSLEETHMYNLIIFPSLCVEHLPWQSSSLLHRFQPNSDRGSLKAIFWMQTTGFPLSANTHVCTRFTVGVPKSRIFAIVLWYKFSLFTCEAEWTGKSAPIVIPVLVRAYELVHGGSSNKSWTSELMWWWVRVYVCIRQFARWSSKQATNSKTSLRSQDPAQLQCWCGPEREVFLIMSAHVSSGHLALTTKVLLCDAYYGARRSSIYSTDQL